MKKSKLNIQISSTEIHQRSKKMNTDKLQAYLKNVNQGVGIRDSKKIYKRHKKHRQSVDDSPRAFYVP